jgi:hypothetical protein
MHSFTFPASRRGRIMTAAMLGIAAVAACSDQQPVASREPALPADGLQAFDCVATVSGAGSVSCTPSAPSTARASGVYLGTQNVYVKLTSSNNSYDAALDVYSFDVTVQNLMNEAIGTPDGVTPDAEGIRVFFVEEPAGVGGTVSVMEPSGTAFFTTANQAYHTYSEILDKDEVSAPKTWKFSVPDGVTSFTFRVLMETDVQYKLVINEVLVNPAGTTIETAGDWVEIFNAGTRPVDLQGLVVADSAASGRRPYHLVNSSVVVPSGGYVVLGTTTTTTSNGGVPVDYSWGGSVSLASSLDAFKVARVVGTDTLTLDRTQYASASTSAQDGISRELKNPALDNSNMDGSNWGSASVTSVYGSGGRGTPKAQNSAFTP